MPPDNEFQSVECLIVYVIGLVSQANPNPIDEIGIF